MVLQQLPGCDRWTDRKYRWCNRKRSSEGGQVSGLYLNTCYVRPTWISWHTGLLWGNHTPETALFSSRRSGVLERDLKTHKKGDNVRRARWSYNYSLHEIIRQTQQQHGDITPLVTTVSAVDKVHKDGGENTVRRDHGEVKTVTVCMSKVSLSAYLQAGHCSYSAPSSSCLHRCWCSEPHRGTGDKHTHKGSRCRATQCNALQPASKPSFEAGWCHLWWHHSNGAEFNDGQWHHPPVFSWPPPCHPSSSPGELGRWTLQQTDAPQKTLACLSSWDPSDCWVLSADRHINQNQYGVSSHDQCKNK